MSKQTKPGIVFAHGLWADGSCFQKLIPTLQAEGHEVTREVSLLNLTRSLPLALSGHRCQLCPCLLLG